MVFVGLSVLGALLPPIRLALFLALLVIVAAELLVNYNALERILYLIPANRDNAEDFSIDFVIRVFTEAPGKSGQAFSIKPVATGADALGAVSSKKNKKG
ncbi:Inositol oxygenase (Myo-inositol oxygenase) [Durusdinium trenchii]|uniref:Inositol oxygenase (Myo-inositol oxygenase) n=2 Tax=Durusdinium trenchii TaxID=1381693 RepID=A0ABP0NQA5_9DINO